MIRELKEAAIETFRTCGGFLLDCGAQYAISQYESDADACVAWRECADACDGCPWHGKCRGTEREV